MHDHLLTNQYPILILPFESYLILFVMYKCKPGSIFIFQFFQQLIYTIEMIYKTIFIILALLVIIWTVIPLQNMEKFCSCDNFYQNNNFYLPYPEQIWNNSTRLQSNYLLYYPWYYM